MSSHKQITAAREPMSSMAMRTRLDASSSRGLIAPVPVGKIVFGMGVGRERRWI